MRGQEDGNGPKIIQRKILSQFGEHIDGNKSPNTKVQSIHGNQIRIIRIVIN